MPTLINYYFEHKILVALVNAETGNAVLIFLLVVTKRKRPLRIAKYSTPY
jgi:hypothetical protein